MANAAAERMYDARHEERPYHDGTFSRWADKASAKTPYHYRDGVTVWVAETDLTPHDHFLGGAKDCDECKEVDSGDTP